MFPSTAPMVCAGGWRMSWSRQAARASLRISTSSAICRQPPRVRSSCGASESTVRQRSGSTAFPPNTSGGSYRERPPGGWRTDRSHGAQARNILQESSLYWNRLRGARRRAGVEIRDSAVCGRKRPARRSKWRIRSAAAIQEDAQSHIRLGGDRVLDTSGSSRFPASVNPRGFGAAPGDAGRGSESADVLRTGASCSPSDPRPRKTLALRDSNQKRSPGRAGKDRAIHRVVPGRRLGTGTAVSGAGHAHPSLTAHP